MGGISLKEGDYMKTELHIITFLLVVVAALNWGLVGLFDFNLVTALFGGLPAFERLVYILVGLSAVYTIATHASSCTICGKKKK